MKKFYKILIAFLIVFCLGFLASYLVIQQQLNKETKEVTSHISIKILRNTSKVVKVSF